MKDRLIQNVIFNKHYKIKMAAERDLSKNLCVYYKTDCDNKDKWIDTKNHVIMRWGLFGRKMICSHCFSKHAIDYLTCIACSEWCDPNTQMVIHDNFRVCFNCLSQYAKNDPEKIFAIGYHIGQKQLKRPTSEYVLKDLVIEVGFSVCNKDKIKTIRPIDESTTIYMKD